MIGIIGQGFVGTALKQGFEKDFAVETYDKYITDRSTCTSLQELCQKTKIVFVCLPTPMNMDGSCNLSIVGDTIKQIDECCRGNIIVIKSTIPPGTTRAFNASCESSDVVFNPEFLTENNAIQDFLNANRIILGGAKKATTTVKKIYMKVFPSTPIIETDPTTAEMVKYITNTFLATKVAYANELYQICSKLDVDYKKAIELSRYDERLGHTHWAVPGHDGHYGFGGSCFPKDLNCLVHIAKLAGADPMVLSAAWKKNLEVRPERDWENLKGRAVTKAK